MSVIENLRNKLKEAKANAIDKAKFRKLVQQETMPIRRKAYLEQKKRLAVEEGKKLAEQSTVVKEPVKKEDFFSTSPTMNFGFDFDKEFNKKSKGRKK